MRDTIYALSSGQGRSAVAVIRITGPDAGKTFAIFRTALPAARRATLVRLVDPRDGDAVDQALALWMPGPYSFTGEDMVELHTHGGRAVVQVVFDILKGAGFALAAPGEFTRRAFENGKMGLDDAEGVADLIDADTKEQRKHALWLMSGGVAEAVALWRSELLDAIALIEASIDFPDEGEIGDGLSSQALERAHALIGLLEASIARVRSGEVLREGFVVLLAGRPNAGKSTLLNALVKRDAAITSEIAGTTRDLIEVKIEIDGMPVIVVDTAGLHATTDPVELKGIERTRARARQAHLILWLGAAADDEPPADLCDVQTDVIRVRTMIDLYPVSDPHAGFAISAVTGAGLPEVLAFLACRAKSVAGIGEPGLVLRYRHLEAASETLDACRSAVSCIRAGQMELAAEDLRVAVAALGRLADPIQTDDVLDRIFGRFCLGK